jgi:hypothetical protein
MIIAFVLVAKDRIAARVKDGCSIVRWVFAAHHDISIMAMARPKGMAEFMHNCMLIREKVVSGIG